MKRTKRMIARAIESGLVLGICICGFCPIGEAGAFTGTTDDTKSAIVVNVAEDSEGATAEGVNSAAIGAEATAEGKNAVAIGYKAEAQDSWSTAVGRKAQALASSSTAIGCGAKAKKDDATAIGAGATAVDEYSSAVGNGTWARGMGSVAVGMNSTTKNDWDVALGAFSTTRDVTVVEGVTIGGKQYAFNGGNEVIAAVSIGVEYKGIGEGGNDAVYTRQLQYLAPGELSATSTDGVNGSQLYATNQAVTKNANAIASLSGRMDKVGAGAAALAALHPLDYDADNKLSFASGYGNYAGANAMALGAFYRPNENCMMSLGGSMGNGENMVNLGVSFAIGKGKSPYASVSKTAMAQTINELQDKNDRLQAQVDKQEATIAELMAKVDALLAKQ